jgi:hypothetical protein
MNNNRQFLSSMVKQLDEAGIKVWVFGGWGEELRGVIEPRPHGDVDLLYPAQDFSMVDEYLAARGNEVTQKRFPHKRAFLNNGVLVELFLVDPDELTTKFWGAKLFRWPANTIMDANERLASVEALLHYRANWQSLQRE